MFLQQKVLTQNSPKTVYISMSIFPEHTFLIYVQTFKRFHQCYDYVIFNQYSEIRKILSIALVVSYHVYQTQIH